MWARITIESHEHWHPRTMMIPSYFKIWSLMMIYSLTNKTSEEEYMINIYIKVVSSKNLIQGYILIKMHWWFANILNAYVDYTIFRIFYPEYKLFLENIPGQEYMKQRWFPFSWRVNETILAQAARLAQLIMQSGQCLKRKLFHESINSIKCTTGEW